MARADGRIEKGQPLNRAISARAWNRAQDAADHVLGVRPGFEAESAWVNNDTIVMRINSAWPTLDHTPLAVGQGIAVPAVSTLSPRLVSQSKNVPPNYYFGGVVEDEQDLADYMPSDAIAIDVLGDDVASPAVARCGIIRSVSLSANWYTCTVQVRGICRCRVLLLGGGSAVVPPPPYPRDTTLRPFWRRYLTVSTYGYSTLLGLGARKFLGASGQFPMVAEAAVFLG